MSLHEQIFESNSLVVLDASFSFWPICAETCMVQVLLEYVLDKEFLFDYQ